MSATWPACARAAYARMSCTKVQKRSGCAGSCYEKVDIIDIAKILNFAYSNIDCAVINKVDNDIDYNNALKISEYVNKKLVICGGLNI